MGIYARLRHGIRRPAAIAALALVAAGLYLWQVGSIWAEQSRVVRYEASHNSDSAQLNGRGIAAGAVATLSFDLRGVRAVMQVQDLPALPASQVYQMWFVDDRGTAAPSSIFRVPADRQTAMTVVLSSPRMLSSYRYFRVTIEPAGGSMIPSGPVVMEN